jgi:hypothetical protein
MISVQMYQENPKLVWRDAQVIEGINLIKEVSVDILVLGKVADVDRALITYDLTNNLRSLLNAPSKKRKQHPGNIIPLLFFDYLIISQPVVRLQMVLFRQEVSFSPMYPLPGLTRTFDVPGDSHGATPPSSTSEGTLTIISVNLTS